VGKVEYIGIQEEQIFLEATASRLATAGLSGTSFDALRAQNAMVEPGNLELSQAYPPIFASGMFQDVGDIQEAQVPTRQGGIVRVRDVTEVRRSFEDPPVQIMRHAIAGQSGGLPCIGLSIHPLPTANVVTVGAQIQEVITRTSSEFPVGIEVVSVADQGAVVAASVRGFTASLGQAVAIVVAVLLIGLGVRIGIIVGLQIPLVIFGAFIGMSVLGIDLHRISLGALIIALGMLVDNSIVVSDMILTRLKEGQAPLEAATGTFRQASRPLAMGTFISILGFSPIFFSVESTGEFLNTLFMVVGLALTISWLSAFTITALNCYLFIKPPKGEGEKGAATSGPFFDRYRRFVRALLRHRVKTLGVLIAATVIAFMAFPFVDKTFFPPSTRPQFVVEVQSPEGSRIEVTDEMVGRLEQFLLADPSVESISSFVGAGIPRYVLTFGPESPAATLGQLLVNTVDHSENVRLRRATRQFVAEAMPDAQLRIEEISLGPSNPYKVAYRISGPDGETLRDLSDQVQALMHRVPGAHEICDDWRGKIPAYRVEVDPDRARRAGVTDSDVAHALQILMEGMQVDTYREDIYQLPITLRGRTAGEDVDLQSLLNTPIPSALGSDVTVPLDQVATARLEWVDGRMFRRDRVPTIEVQCNANADGGHTAEGVRQILDQMIQEEIDLPPDYSAVWGAEYEDTVDSQKALFGFLPVTIILITLLLIAQFNSARRFLILILNVPFALSGVIVGLLLFRQSFGFVALMGMLALFGMLINIGIMLMDQIEGNMAGGMSRFDALVEASVMRVRAIGLSAGTTVLGMVPLVISDPFWRSLGVLIMFGLGLGAFLTPIVIPLLYSFLFRVKEEEPAPAEAPGDGTPAA
jgi:multidrug efflux pump subunit AcrB